MLRRFLIFCMTVVLLGACSDTADIWPGNPPQVREITIREGSYTARTNFYYDIYSALTGILFTGPGNVYDCEAGFTIANKVMQIPSAIDSEDIIEIVWEEGRMVQYFSGDRIVHFNYEQDRLASVETLLNGMRESVCIITHDGVNIKVIEKYDADETLVSKTEFLSYDTNLNLLTTQWWYWWIAWDKGYHWEEAFPILPFMRNNPLQIKTTIGGSTWTDDITYTVDENDLITMMAIEGDHDPYSYTILY